MNIETILQSLPAQEVYIRADNTKLLWDDGLSEWQILQANGVGRVWKILESFNEFDDALKEFVCIVELSAKLGS